MNTARLRASLSIAGLTTEFHLSSKPVAFGNMGKNTLSIELKLNPEKTNEINRAVELMQLQHYDGDER